MTRKSPGQPVEILLVEDNLADIRLTQEAFKDGKVTNNLNVMRDGVEAVDYLKKKGKYHKAARPDIILLDLNLPKKNGHEVLEVIKADEDLKRIPVIVLTVSDDEKDIYKAYIRHANCYITKPVDLAKFLDAIKSVKDFWLTIVKLPG